ncbi:hypothetical protein [Halorientalis halophila]|uniref:hypothetical protein n=1 Tax=Halorientalis halophila TaxID=3108499 RepID=UPI003009F222
MALGTSAIFNILSVLFLLVPGYSALRGYLNSTVQLDTNSRIDKLIIGITGGLITLALMLIAHRFGILAFLGDFVEGIVADKSSIASIGYSEDYEVSLSTTPEISALAIILFILIQSLIGYVGAYMLGTVIYLKQDKTRKIEKNLSQPWDTAVEKARLDEEVTVITKNETKIKGKLYRIGSPSKNFDVLLKAAEKHYDDESKDPDPLGVTYHHYEDISQVRLEDIEPGPVPEPGNWFFRNYLRIKKYLNYLFCWLKIRYWLFIYNYKMSSLLTLASTQASRLYKRLRN